MDKKNNSVIAAIMSEAGKLVTYCFDKRTFEIIDRFADIDFTFTQCRLVHTSTRHVTLARTIYETPTRPGQILSGRIWLFRE
ncbi:hypothetical protein OAM69_00240 [bacterium]|nr:hypothetical protein [bacterium]